MMTDQTENPAYKAFEELGANVARQIAIRNAQQNQPITAGE
jgi:hypothetical protein